MNGKLMTKLFHARRPDLNQTFISVSLLISFLLNLGCYLHYLCFAGKCYFSFVLSVSSVIKSNLQHNGVFLYQEISDVHPWWFLKAKIRFICARTFQRSFVVSSIPDFLFYFTKRINSSWSGEGKDSQIQEFTVIWRIWIRNLIHAIQSQFLSKGVFSKVNPTSSFTLH